MKTFEQFINESVRNSGDTIEKMVDFLRVHLEEEELFKADRIEKIDAEDYLIYTLDKDKFERLSGIHLNNITLEDFTTAKPYDRRQDVRDGNDGTIEIGLLDAHDIGKWGIFRKFEKEAIESSYNDYILIFISDKNTKRISAVEYAKNTSRFRFNTNLEEMVDTKECLTTNKDFIDLYYSYRNSYLAKPAKVNPLYI